MGLLHAGLFAYIYVRPDLRASLGATALVIGMIGSHMPKKLRYWSFLHGRVVTG
jgi:hypothetical protein